MGDGMPFVDDDFTENDVQARISGQSRGGVSGGGSGGVGGGGDGSVAGGGGERLRPEEIEGAAGGGRGGGGGHVEEIQQEAQRFKIVINRDAGGVVTLKDIREQIPGEMMDRAMTNDDDDEHFDDDDEFDDDDL